MAFLAGERITAARLNRIQTKSYYAVGSGTVPASTTADVTDATVTFTTEVANAEYRVWAVFDFIGAGSGGATLGRIAVDGVNQNPLSTFQPSAASQRGTSPQNYRGTLAAAGSHTIKLVAQVSTNASCAGTNCSILVEIAEVV